MTSDKYRAYRGSTNFSSEEKKARFSAPSEFIL